MTPRRDRAEGCSRASVVLVPVLALALAAGALLAGCATGGGRASTGADRSESAELAGARRQCDRLKAIELARPPVQTPVDRWLVRAQEALLAGKTRLAKARAARLTEACRTEARHRGDLVMLRREIARAGARIKPGSVARFDALCEAADYSNAIICGEALLADDPDRCAPPPLRGPGRAAGAAAGEGGEGGEEQAAGRGDEAEQEPEAEVDSSAPRAFRMLVSLGVGVGSADLGGVHRGAEDLGAVFNAHNPAQPLRDGAPTSGVQVNNELSVRYYFPYHLLAQLGLATIYNSASSGFGLGSSTLSNDNLGLEIPLLVGAYYTLAGQLDLYAALGPSLLVLSGSYWTSDPGYAPDFEAPAAVGAHFVIGADLVLGRSWALGLDLRYRLLRGGELADRETGEVLVSGDLLGDGSTSTYDFDLSGFSAALYLRFFVL